MSTRSFVLVVGLFAAFSGPFRSTDADGNMASETASFCFGVNGYHGTVDVEIWELAPTTILNSNPQATCDGNNGGGESQVLMRFDGIIGENPGQIPPGATVVSAKLLVSAFDQGNTVHLHRMLVPFGEAPTWNKMISGVTADDLEAQRAKESFTFGNIAASASYVPFEVTDTVQAWVSGDENHGWVFLNTGGNGWDFYTSDFDKFAQRPKLVVEFLPAR
ncbi:hypothetical protein KOR42_44260 [Thalassoglobus neptunius]|uniref:DNRLRE domain-containing protein n=1 Tax=Thalassoglobus neptunius TaxID=1938619 RepID=A0A5C5VY37_9PLAN|nr:DNRLRE domain-containing protein [Thalassoglobus neptunius]TWT43546.1 hypothetical protein KOR42_44260 [Thalassoglobus neptunius]